jgi:hypothetical protein
VPPDLERIVLSCLAKQPGDRPPSAAALDQQLAAADVVPWSDADARQWWESTNALSDDLERNADRTTAGYGPGMSVTRTAIDL